MGLSLYAPSGGSILCCDHWAEQGSGGGSSSFTKTFRLHLTSISLQCMVTLMNTTRLKSVRMYTIFNINCVILACLNEFKYPTPNFRGLNLITPTTPQYMNGHFALCLSIFTEKKDMFISLWYLVVPLRSRFIIQSYLNLTILSFS